MKRRSTRRLGVESLENRDLMAGDVSVHLKNGNLVITGDAADNKIQITQVSANQYQVRGIQTKINGKNAAATFVVNKNVQINMNGGNDVVSIGSSSGSSTNLKGNLSINMGSGNDIINVFSSRVRNVNLKLGGGRDKINFDGSITVTGVIKADGGAGRDTAHQSAGTSYNVDPNKPHEITNFEVENTPF